MEKYEQPYQSCPICASNDISQYHQDFRDNKIFKCGHCSVEFMNPVYSDEYLADYYSKYYEGADNSLQEQSALEGQRRNNAVKMDILAKFIEKPGNLFDFGCGNGNFLEYTKKLGWQGEGYDVDCAAMKPVADRLGTKIYCGDFIETDVPEASFDLVHAHHVVEHLKDPVRDIKKLHKLIKPGGYLYVAVPNINGYSSRLKFFLEKIGLRKKNIGKYYDTDHHIFYYSPKSLHHLLESNGFKVHLSMTGSKATMSENKWVQFFSYYLTAKLCAGSAFLVIASKEGN